jgi:hypothetical protein
MKRLLMICILLMATNVFGQRFSPAHTLRHLYHKTSGWQTLDGAGASTTIKFDWTVNNDTTISNGSAWGTMALWLAVDTLKADVSTTDSLEVTYKVLKEDAGGNDYASSYYDSTTIDATFDWTSGSGTSSIWKRWDIAPGIGMGIEVRLENDSARDDSIRVKVDLIYQ